MRLTLVLGTSTGGVGRHVREVAERMVERGYTVTVAGPAPTEERFGFTGAGARFEPVRIAASPRPTRDVVTVRALRAILSDTDVVHAHGIRAGALSCLALGRHHSVPYVVTLHNAILATGTKALLLSGLERLSVARADVVLGASTDLVEHAHRLGAEDARFAPIPAPQLPEPTRDRAQVREELGLADDQCLALAVGRLAPQKDYPTLLDAAQLWEREWPPDGPSARAPRLAIVGSGPLRTELQRTIDARQLGATLIGHRTDIADLLGAADLLVVTSLWEARAFVIQEAMRARVPVIATATGGTPYLAGDAAVLVPTRDPQAVAAAVIRLAAHADERARFAELGYQHAQTWPDTEQALRQLAGLYAELGA